MISEFAPAPGGQGDWHSEFGVATVSPMHQLLRVDTAAVEAMANRWANSLPDVEETAQPSELGLSCQPSATAINAAHADVTTFVTALSARVAAHVANVALADVEYTASEFRTSNMLAGAAHPIAVA